MSVNGKCAYEYHIYAEIWIKIDRLYGLSLYVASIALCIVLVTRQAPITWYRASFVRFKAANCSHAGSHGRETIKLWNVRISVSSRLYRILYHFTESAGPMTRYWAIVVRLNATNWLHAGSHGRETINLWNVRISVSNRLYRFLYHFTDSPGPKFTISSHFRPC